MALKFNITGVPPSAEDIQAGIAYQKRRFWRFSLWSLVPIAIISYAMMCGLWQLQQMLRDESHPIPFLEAPFLENAVLLTIGISAFVMACNLDIFYGDKRKLTTLDLPRCHKALTLSTEYPEIEAYRLAVIKHRKLVNADLDAMERFPEEQAQRLAKAMLQQDFEALHSVGEGN